MVEFGCLDGEKPASARWSIKISGGAEANDGLACDVVMKVEIGRCTATWAEFRENNFEVLFSNFNLKIK